MYKIRPLARSLWSLELSETAEINIRFLPDIFENEKIRQVTSP